MVSVEDWHQYSYLRSEHEMQASKKFVHPLKYVACSIRNK